MLTVPFAQRLHALLDIALSLEPLKVAGWLMEQYYLWYRGLLQLIAATGSRDTEAFEPADLRSEALYCPQRQPCNVLRLHSSMQVAWAFTVPVFDDTCHHSSAGSHHLCKGQCCFLILVDLVSCGAFHLSLELTAWHMKWSEADISTNLMIGWLQKQCLFTQVSRKQIPCTLSRKGLVNRARSLGYDPFGTVYF